MGTDLFKDILGCEGKYKASVDGTIISTYHNKIKIMKQYVGTNGYMYFRCYLNGKARHMSVARAVASAFPEICGEWFEGCTVDHIDTNRHNNIATNLRVVTLYENQNNPLTKENRKKYKTDEEREAARKASRRSDYLKHKDYYNNYIKQYLKDNPDKAKEYARRAYANRSEEAIEKGRKRSLAYYHAHKEEISAKQKERYRQKKNEGGVHRHPPST